MQTKKLEQLFAEFERTAAPAGLFDRIILAIRREQEQQQTKRLLFGLLFLFVLSCAATPLAWNLLAREAANSGIHYLFSAAFSDLGTFFLMWQDFSLAILEALPLGGIIAFAFSASLALFTIRLFLYRKRLLLGYVKNLLFA